MRLVSCTRDVYVCLENFVSNNFCFSGMTNRHGHWVCWMSMRRKSKLLFGISGWCLCCCYALYPKNNKEEERTSKIVVSTWWLSSKQCCLSAGLRCRTLLSGRHERAALCTLLLCAGPIAGCSAVLAVGRCCGYRSLVCALAVCTKQKKKKEERKK